VVNRGESWSKHIRLKWNIKIKWNLILIKMEFHSKQVGERLKQARKQRKASQSDIAEAIGVGVSAFSSYETGVSSPTAENLVKISILLGISIDWLLLGEGPMYRSDSMNGAVEAANGLANAQNVSKFAKKGYSPMTEQEREEHKQMLERIRQLEQIVEQQSSTIDRLVRMLEERK
jgi:transcriptional regulator with XRE-family HTH domain